MPLVVMAEFHGLLPREELPFSGLTNGRCSLTKRSEIAKDCQKGSYATFAMICAVL